MFVHMLIYQWKSKISGNYYLDRDPKSFRHILAYLRLKKEKFVLSLALPAKPDDLAKYVDRTIADYTPVAFKNVVFITLNYYFQDLT